MTDDPAATSWTRGETAPFPVPRGPGLPGRPALARGPALPGDSVIPGGLPGSPALAGGESVGDQGASAAAIDSDHDRVAIDSAPAAPVEDRRSALLGGLALTAAVVAIVVQGVAITVASSGDYTLGSTLAVASIALGGTAIPLGILALILRRGPVRGLIGAVLALLTNPLVLVAVLRYFGGA